MVNNHSVSFVFSDNDLRNMIAILNRVLGFRCPIAERPFYKDLPPEIKLGKYQKEQLTQLRKTLVAALPLSQRKGVK